MPPLVLLLVGAAALAGLALLALGLRGRRMDDHPICRRCRFDLVGVYAAQSTCPECGAGLKRPHAIRRGHRRVRPVVASLAATLLLFVAVASVAHTWATATGFDWNSIKPARLLLIEARLFHSAAAREHLARRYRSGLLSPIDTTQLADLALDIHAKDRAPWNASWERLLQDLALAGDLTDDDLIRLARQMLRLDIGVRPRLRAGTWAGVRVSTDYRRPVSNLPIRFSIDVGGIELGREPGTRRGQASHRWIPGSDPGGDWHTVVISVPVRLEPGRHEVPVSVTSLVTGFDRGGLNAEWRHEDTLVVEVVPADVEIVQRLRGPDFDEAVRAAARAADVRLLNDPPRRLNDRRPDAGPAIIQGRVSVDALPFPLAGRLALVAPDGSEYAVGDARAIEPRDAAAAPDANEPSHGMDLGRRVPSLAFGVPLDLVLRSDLEWAEYQWLESAWEGQIVLASGLLLEAPPPVGEEELVAELVRELDRRDEGVRVRAIESLTARIEADALPEAVLADLVERALAHQGDPEQRWIPAWGDLIEAARGKGHLSADQQARFARQAFSTRHRVHPRARSGHPIEVACGVGGARVGRGVILATRCTLDQITVGDLTLEGSGPASEFTVPAAGSEVQSLDIPLEPGRHRVVTRWTWGVCEIGRARSAAEVLITDRPPFVEWTVEHEGTVQVYAPSEQPVRLVTDDSLRERVRGSVLLSRCAVEVYGDGPERVAHGWVQFDDPPMPLSFDVYWSDGEREWKVGQIAYGPRGASANYIGTVDDAFTAEMVAVILRPNTDAALSDGILEIWGEELEFPGTPVEWTGATAPPAPGGPSAEPDGH